MKERSLLPVTEAAMVSVSLAAVVSFSRLFADGSFFWRLCAFAVASHLCALVARRLRWSLPAASALSIVALPIVIGVVLYPSSTIAGLPTADTMRALRSDLGGVYTQFQSVIAPTPVTTGFLLAAGLALWWAAFVADWAAFRLWVPFESVVPAGTVFVFASLFAAKQYRVESAALFVAASLAFLLLHRITRQQVSVGWMSSDVHRGIRALLGMGAVLAVGAVVTAVVVGPRTPGAGADPLLDWRGERGGAGARTTISPFVEIRRRLVDQSLTELFTVQSDQRAYWRLTALDQFDGNIWSSNGSYEKAKGSLPTQLDSSAPSTTSTQRFTITNLAAIWLPAAFEPRRLDASGASVRYDPQSSTLIVGSELPTSDRLTYTVQSALPAFQPDQLAGASGDVPPDIRRRDLALPDSIGAGVVSLARQITEGKSTPYEKALALQNYFRDGSFTYTLDAPAGESANAIEAFLQSKRGYCEQFAGTYAAMARVVGLPSRVAVGFTPGEEVAPGTFVVRGEHAHAWPEVYINGQGWVLFEPTPQRGAPNAQQYTGVPEQQSTGGGVGATTVPTTAPAPTATTAPAGATPTTRPRDPGTLDTGAPKRSRQWTTTWLPRIIAAAIAALAALVLYALAMPISRAVRRRRRRARAREPVDRVRVAWDESVEAVGLLGLQPSRDETPAEFAKRTDPLLEASLVSPLARSLEAAEYSREGVGEEEADEAFALAGGVEAAVRSRTTRQQRARALLDPRRPGQRRRSRTPTGGRRREQKAGAPPVELLRR